jgi:tetratricopeptide (TPR) repeat protein
MKTIITTLVLFISLSLPAQTGYEKAMQKGLELMASDLQAASQQFERISKAEKENWLPPYYAALCNINGSWGQNSKEQTLLHLNKAQELINEAEFLSDNNPEIMVLQGMLNTCWIQYDSRTYGMKLSGATNAIYEKALQLAPQNPRVISNRARWLMGSAKFFGKDIAPYCGQIDKAIELFEKEIPTGFDPSWGEKGATDVKKQCEK